MSVEAVGIPSGDAHLHSEWFSRLFEVPPTFVTDSKLLRQAADDAGLLATDFSGSLELTAQEKRSVIVAPVKAERLPVRAFFETVLSDSAMMVLPIVSFSGTEEACQYFWNRVALLDVESAARTNLQILSDMAERGRARITGGGCDLWLELSDSVSIMNPKTTTMVRPGEWISIAQYLEVGIVPGLFEKRPPYSLSGTMVADGMLAANHRYMYAYARPYVERAWDLIQSHRSGTQHRLTITLEDSHVTSVVAEDDTELLPELLSCVEETYADGLVELGFATGTLPQAIVDWNINSQLNEASGGIHIALGAGVSRAHIDFVCTGATVTWS